MGATRYIEVALGTNVKEVFNQLHGEAEAQYGYDMYNGTISTTSIGHEVKVKNEDDMDIDDNYLFPEKWFTNYANLGIDHYKAFTAKWVGNEETPKREKGVRTIQKFSIMSVDNNRRSYKNFNKLSDAKREAKELALKIGKNVTIKKHRSNGDLFQIGQMSLVSDGKEYKSARKAKTKVYLPIHKFAFFVYASE